MFHFEKVLNVITLPPDTRTVQMIYTELLEHPNLNDVLILESAYVQYAKDKKQELRKRINAFSTQETLSSEEELRLSKHLQELTDMRVFEKELEEFKLAALPTEEDTSLDLLVRDELYNDEGLSHALYNLLSLRITSPETYEPSKASFFEHYPHTENNFDTYIKAFKQLYNM